MIFFLIFAHFDAIFTDFETHNGKAGQVNQINKGQGECSDLC